MVQKHTAVASAKLQSAPTLYRFLFLAMLVGSSVSLPAAGVAQDLERGRAAANRGDFLSARREWEPLAARGNAQASFNLGRLYARGDGVARDFRRAFSYFEGAARLGHREAASKLAIMYQNGDGVRVSTEQARYWQKVSQGKLSPPPPADSGTSPAALPRMELGDSKTPLPSLPLVPVEQASQVGKAPSRDEFVGPTNTFAFGTPPEQPIPFAAEEVKSETVSPLLDPVPSEPLPVLEATPLPTMRPTPPPRSFRSLPRPFRTPEGVTIGSGEEGDAKDSPVLGRSREKSSSSNPTESTEANQGAQTPGTVGERVRGLFW
jgi:hypothetical protein